MGVLQLPVAHLCDGGLHLTGVHLLHHLLWIATQPCDEQQQQQEEGQEKEVQQPFT